MKKYKLLNTKGLLLTLGSAAAIVAPIATVISCGGPSAKTMDTGVIDQKIQQQKIDMIHETMFKELGGWSLNSMDIFERVFNTEESGLINVSRLNSANKTPSFDDKLIDTTLMVNGAPQHMDRDITKANPAFKIDVTKAEIISNKDALKNINKSIVDFMTSNPAEYAAHVIVKTQDGKDTTGTFSKGVYQIQLFKKSATDAKANALFSILSDKSKMSVDTSLLNTAGGTYLMGQWGHSFSMGSGTGFDEFGTKVTQKGTYHDRSNEDNLKAWTAFGPTSDTSITQQDKDSVKDLHVNQYLEEDRKTHIFTLVTTALVNGAISTNYLPLPELNSFDSKQHDVNKIVDILTSKKNFAFYYNYLSDMDTSQADMTESAKRHIISLSALMPVMAKVSDLMHNQQFITDLVNFIKSEDANFSFGTFQTVLENMADNKFENGWDFGPKTYGIMHYTERFFEHVKNFLLNNKDWDGKAIQISSAKDFFEQQKAEAEYKQYLEDHKDTLAVLNLQSTSDKTTTKTEVEYYELSKSHPTEMAAATTKLGTSATKAEIVAEVKLHVDPISGLQAEADKHRGQVGWTAHEHNAPTKPYTSSGPDGLDELTKWIMSNDTNAKDFSLVVKSHDADNVVIDIVLFNKTNLGFIAKLLPAPANVYRTLTNITVANFK